MHPLWYDSCSLCKAWLNERQSSRNSLEKQPERQRPGLIKFSPLSKRSSYEIAETAIKSKPYVNTSQRARERARLAYTFANSTYNDLKSSYESISESHRFSRRIVNPLFTWKGENTRVITGKSLGATTIEDRKLGSKTVIHAASHNYVGFYRMNEQSEQIHKLALDCLPTAPRQSSSAISVAFHNELARVFQADFCYTTSTGYGSNLLAFPAILQPGWLCVLDAKSHNSMYVGAYISNADKVIKYRHNDMSHLEQLLEEHHSRYDNIMIAVEGLYSMDGTIPPLNALSKLKQRYGFVLLGDEAHSLLSIGKTGKGCVELWNDTHPEAPVGNDLVDIRTATLSKSLGSIGGMVCGKEEFRSRVAARWHEMRDGGFDPVLTAAMVQCLHILGQPTLLRRRLTRMRQINHWARSELTRFGVHVYGDAITPVLPIHTGRASAAAKLSYKLRQHGVLATPVSVPAVPFWQARVRVCLSADHTDAQINTLIRTIIKAAQEIGVATASRLKPRIFETCPSETHADTETLEALESCRYIEELIQQDRGTQPTRIDSDIVKAGHQARQRYGLAAGGARWISGTFSVHLEVEKLISEVLHMPAAMSYADSSLGLLSTISALCRPLLKRKTHRLLLPKDCHQAVLAGVKAAPKKSCPEVSHYNDLDDLRTQITTASARREQVTVYLPIFAFHPEPSDDTDQHSANMIARFDSFINKLRHLGNLDNHLTILLHDTEAHLKPITGRRTLISISEKLHGLTKSLLVYGSFMSNFEVPGAYLAGDERLVEELRYSSRGYMFTTASLPFVMGMVKHGLENPL